MGWQPHVDAFCKKVSAGEGVIQRIRSLVLRETLLKIYYALVAPYFDYCSEVARSRTQGEQGCRNGESTRLPLMWPGFDSGHGPYVG